ncbi:MAG: TonB-dependent receptor [Ferruginibacter sp.]
MRKLLMPLLLFVFQTPVFSQGGSVSGQVRDGQTNNPLPGATVNIKGTLKSSITNNEGYFILQKITAGKIILQVSYVGYETAEITADITNGVTPGVNVALALDSRMGNEIVVSASRRPEKITDAPASIQVINKKDLEQFSGSNVFELLSNVQGVEFSRPGVDVVSINARGLNNAFNNKIFQMVDGRNSMNPLSGSLMMGNNYSVVKEDIERIEIVLGPQTALYGPNVHNALINFITKDPRKFQGTTVSLSAGNQYQFSGRIRQATKINNKWAYKLTGEYAVGKEFEFYDSIYAGGGPGGVFGPAVAIPEDNIDFNFRHIRGEAHVYYSINPKADIIISTGGSDNNSLNTNTGGRNQFTGVTNSFVQGRFNSPHFFVTLYNAWAGFGTSFNIGAYTRDYWNRTHSTATAGPNRRLPPDSARINALRYGNTLKENPGRLNTEAQYNYTFNKAGLFLVAGLSYQKDKPRAYGITLVDSFQRIYVTQYGAVLQLEKSLPYRFRFVGAGRWDNHSNFGNFFSPKLGLVKGMGDGNLRVTWGKAYSMPSVLYQYASTFGIFFGNGEGITYIPNNSKFSDPTSRRTTLPLKPEEVSTWELGYKGTVAKKLFVDISYFNGLSKNFFSPSISVGGRALNVGDKNVSHNPFFAGQVVNDTLKNASFLTIFNYGNVKVYGLDLGLSYSFNKIVNLALRYSWIGSDITKGNIDNDANKDGKVLADEKNLNSPKNRGAAILSFQNLCKQKIFINVSARFVQQYDFYSGNQISTAAGKGSRGKVGNYIKNFDWGPLGGFTTLDLGAGYKMNDMVSVGMGVTNLFDTEQREFAGSPSIGRLISFEIKAHVPKKL